MVNNSKNSQRRLLIALALFFASIAASLLISMAANKGKDYWVLMHPVPAGAPIERADLTIGSALLSFREAGYLLSSSSPIGLTASRNLRAGELLSSHDLSAKNSRATTVQVAISVQSSDIPASISVGDSLSIFQIFETQNGEANQSPRRVLNNAFLSAIDREGFKFGGEAIITLAIETNQLESLLSAKSSGRLVMVASYD